MKLVFYFSYSTNARMAFLISRNASKHVLLSFVPSYSQGCPDVEIYRGLSSVAFKSHRITLIRGHEDKTKVFVTLRKKRK